MLKQQWIGFWFVTFFLTLFFLTLFPYRQDGDTCFPSHCLGCCPEKRTIVLHSEVQITEWPLWVNVAVDALLWIRCCILSMVKYWCLWQPRKGASESSSCRGRNKGWSRLLRSESTTAFGRKPRLPRAASNLTKRGKNRQSGPFLGEKGLLGWWICLKDFLATKVNFLRIALRFSLPSFPLSLAGVWAASWSDSSPSLPWLLPHFPSQVFPPVNLLND